MPEKRKTERIKAVIFTTVYDADTKSLLGYLGDLTLEGAMVVGEKPVQLDTNVKLRIEFRGTSDAAQVQVTIPAHVAWCRQEKESAYYNTGFEFLELNNKNRQVLETYVIKYKFGARS